MKEGHVESNHLVGLQVTKFAMEAVQRDVTAIINELKNGNMSKLRAVKINNCFGDVKEICDLLLKPVRLQCMSACMFSGSV